VLFVQKFIQAGFKRPDRLLGGGLSKNGIVKQKDRDPGMIPDPGQSKIN
jgi:hypothetical protein